jgi:hypothetical protein
VVVSFGSHRDTGCAGSWVRALRASFPRLTPSTNGSELCKATTHRYLKNLGINHIRPRRHTWRKRLRKTATLWGKNQLYSSDFECLNRGVKRKHRPEDLVLAVMGMTGSGKSSVVALCSGDQSRVGHALQSCTPTTRILPC